MASPSSMRPWAVQPKKRPSRPRGPQFFLDPVSGRPVEASAWRQLRQQDVQAGRKAGGRKEARAVRGQYRKARRGKLRFDTSQGGPGGPGSEPQATTDPYTGAPTVNVFVGNQGQDGGQYPTGSMAPAAPRSVTDRTKVDLANQVENL